MFSRIRPLEGGETDERSDGGARCVHVERNARGERIIAKCSGEESHFDLDGALSSASQLEAYRVSSNAIVDSALRGYHGTILAYGQTGSGKTHTVFGGEGDDEGIAPRAFRQIFDAAAADEDKAEYSVSVSLVQIYCEVVTDLLAQSHEGRNEHLNIREADGRVFLENVAVKRVRSASEAMEIVSEGRANRIRGATNINEMSSRSHVCTIVRIERRGAISLTRFDEESL